MNAAEEYFSRKPLEDGCFWIQSPFSEVAMCEVEHGIKENVRDIVF